MKKGSKIDFSQQPLVASHFGQQQWIREVHISRIELSCVFFSGRYMHGSHGQVPVNIYLETGENATNTIIFQRKHAASQFRKLRLIRKVLLVWLICGIACLIGVSHGNCC